MPHGTSNNTADSLSIRPYTVDDWDAVCAIHDRARHDELAGSVDPRAFRPMAEVAEQDFFFASETFVACDPGAGGRVVGFVSFRGPYVTWLYVNPDHYRRGTGRRLLREAVRRCGPGAWVNTLAGNAAAVALYEGEGFEVVKRIPGDCDGYPCVCLRLALPTSPMHDPDAAPG